MSKSKARLLVPEREKTNEWIKSIINEIKDLASNTEDRQVDITCWNYFNNNINDVEFDYLTKVGENHLPTQMRHIPCQRTYLDILISEQTSRGFAFSAYLTDRNSMIEKKEDKVNQITMKMMNKSREKYHQLSFATEQLDMQYQSAQQQFQQAQQAVQQGQLDPSQLTQMQIALMNADHEMQKIKSTINDGLLIAQDDMAEIQSHYKYNYRHWKEELLQKASVKIRQETRLKQSSVYNFTQYLVTGKQAYHVQIESGHKYPTISPIKTMDLFYPIVNNIDYIQDLPWAKYDYKLSYDDIVRLHGKEITDKYGFDVLKNLETNIAVQSGNMYSGPNGEGYFTNTNLMTGTDGGYDTMVSKIYFKAPKMVYIKYSPNKHEQGRYFRKFITSDKIMLLEEDYRWYKEENIYINKNNNTETYKKEEVELYSKKKGQKYITMYMTDLYEATVIDRQYIVDERKCDYVNRDSDDWSKVKLPFYGPAFNNVDKKPYSLIWASKGLQDIYNILWMQRDLTIALGGTKTVLYDESQKPLHLTEEEIDYNKKLGKMHIQTVTKDGRKVNSSFNQWQMFDLSLSQSVQLFDAMIEQTNNTMGDILGIPRQRKGQMLQQDQVGTTEMALRQSSLVTKIYFYNHDLYESQALEAAINLFVKYQLNEDTIMDIYTDDYTQETIELKKEIFKDVKAEVRIHNNSENDLKLQQLKDFIMMSHKEGMLPADMVVSLFSIDNLREMDRKVRHFTQEARKLQQQSQSDAQNGQMQLQEQKIKLEQEFISYWKEQEFSMKNEQQKVADQLKQIELTIMSEKNMVDREKMNLEAKVKMLELVNEDKTETAYLEEQKQSRQIDNQFKQTQLHLDSLFNMLQINDSKESNDKSHNAQLKKIEVDKIKAKSITRKEQISDR